MEVNHANEAGYTGERYEPQDGALVVGGGLASIDVVKVLMLETARAALAKRGIEVAMVDLEIKGIPKLLKAHGLEFGELELEGCTLVYRRRGEDMPVVGIPEGATEERAEKVRNARRRLLEKAMEKYRFRFEPLAMPDGLLVEDDRLVGLRFRRTRVENGKVLPTDEVFERRGSCVISSIGSIPDTLGGIPMKGELFDFSEWNLGRLPGFPTVFSVGNVVTGKGNIVASRKHAVAVAEAVIERFLGLAEGSHAGEEALLEGAREEARATAEGIGNEIAKQPPLAPGALEKILTRVRERQRAVGYAGGYRAWIQSVTPPDLE